MRPGISPTNYFMMVSIKFKTFFTGFIFHTIHTVFIVKGAYRSASKHIHVLFFYLLFPSLSMGVHLSVCVRAYPAQLPCCDSAFTTDARLPPFRPEFRCVASTCHVSTFTLFVLNWPLDTSHRPVSLLLFFRRIHGLQC